MNHAIKMVLLAQATADVNRYLQSLLDFDTVHIEGRNFMGAAANGLGLPAREGRDIYDKDFPKFKESLLTWVELKTQFEIGEATKKAEAEQSAHTARLFEFRKSGEETERIISEGYQSAPEGADDDFIQLFNSSRDAFLQAAKHVSKNLMQIIQIKHRLTLEYCFTGHLVSEETAMKLVELYEIK